MTKIAAPAAACVLLAGCATAPTQQAIGDATLSGAVNGVKCNLAHYFADGSNLINERFAISGVTAKLTFAGAVTTTQSGKAGVKIPLGPVTFGPTFSAGASATDGGSIAPTFEFRVVDARKPDPNKPDKMIDKGADELRGEIATYVESVNASLTAVCAGALPIRYPANLSFDRNAASEIARENEEGLALAGLLQAYRDEIFQIAEGYPLVKPKQVVMSFSLSGGKTSAAGASVDFLVVSLGAETKREARRSFDLVMTFDLGSSSLTREFNWSPDM